ncbi:MAG: YraN family protein [Acidimicrobiales bacterium]
MSRHNISLGTAGEGQAARWYRRRGYRVLDQNWRCGRLGEIDIVARRGNVLVFGEVKTRSTTRFGVPAAAVTLDKQRRIRRLARRWQVEHEVNAARVRFDVISVLGGRLEVLRAAF